MFVACTYVEAVADFGRLVFVEFDCCGWNRVLTITLVRGEYMAVPVDDIE